MDETQKTVWLAVRASNKGNAEVFGAYVAKGLAEQRVKMAIAEASQKQFWNSGEAKTFKAVEVGLYDSFVAGILEESTVLSSPLGGVFSVSGH